MFCLMSCFVFYQQYGVTCMQNIYEKWFWSHYTTLLTFKNRTWSFTNAHLLVVTTKVQPRDTQPTTICGTVKVKYIRWHNSDNVDQSFTHILFCHYIFLLFMFLVVSGHLYEFERGWKRVMWQWNAHKAHPYLVYCRGWTLNEWLLPLLFYTHDYTQSIYNYQLYWQNGNVKAQGWVVVSFWRVVFLCTLWFDYLIK